MLSLCRLRAQREPYCAFKQLLPMMMMTMMLQRMHACVQVGRMKEQLWMSYM